MRGLNLVGNDKIQMNQWTQTRRIAVSTVHFPRTVEFTCPTSGMFSLISLGISTSGTILKYSFSLTVLCRRQGWCIMIKSVIPSSQIASNLEFVVSPLCLLWSAEEVLLLGDVDRAADDAQLGARLEQPEQTHRGRRLKREYRSFVRNL